MAVSLQTSPKSRLRQTPLTKIVDLSGRSLDDLLPQTRTPVILEDNNGILAITADYWAGKLKIQNPKWEELSRQKGIRAYELLSELERTRKVYQQRGKIFEECLVVQAMREIKQGSSYITGEAYHPVIEGKTIDFSDFLKSYGRTEIRV